MTSRLQYKSLPLRCRLPETVVPYTDTLSGWKIEDEWVQTGDIEHNVALVDYQISFSREISRKEDRDDQVKELFDLQEEAFLIIADLKLLWVFIFGGLQTMSRTIPASNAPENWTANSREVLNYFHPAKMFVTTGLSAHPWVILPYEPLEKLMVAYRAYKNASAPLKTLVELYYDSLQSDGQAKMFTLAKSLELVRAILPGNTDRERIQHLSNEVRAVLTRDFSWLFTIANNRYETRHIVSDKMGPLLHPQVTSDEKMEFIKNASRIIRATICQAFGIPFLHSENPQHLITDHREL